MNTITLPADWAIRRAIELSAVRRTPVSVRIFAKENPELIAFARYIEERE